ncbi:MAG: tRNA (adenosine(37)-N6)-dimethylallyltransferase MiaA, partial [Flavobacteriaceae bacterium]|nr:tRNA (adenosine(37)-N6)-dimethylallyltransferase MiaA [Flavobacteriaceae bacterium]
TVGYKEFFKYFDDKISYTDAIDKIKQNTRNYAKRQITWLKKYNNSIRVNYNEDVNKIINLLYKTN